MSEHEESTEQKSGGFRVRYDAEPLSAKQERAAILLAEGASGVDAAKSLKVSPQTIVEWKKKHLFQAAYNQQRRDIVNATRERIRHGIKQASDTLLELLNDEDSKIRLSASRILLDKIDNPEKTSWGIGKTTVQELIEAEYAEYQHKQLYSTGGILGGDIPEYTKKAIADIISNKDIEYAEMQEETTEEDI